jgi:hypothetical protein
MNTTHIKNKFTGYEANIFHKGELPAISTVEKHLRRAKSSECISHTEIFQIDGGRRFLIELVDRGNGKELLYV